MGLFMAGALVAQPAGLLIGGALIGIVDFSGTALIIAGLLTAIAAILAIAPVMRELDAIPPAPVDTSE
jgi:hypothetical protein